MKGARWTWLLALASLLSVASARAELAPPSVAPGPGSGASPASISPPVVPPAAESAKGGALPVTSAHAETATASSPAALPALEVPVPKATDAGQVTTDHALVVGRWGVEARRVSAAVGTFALRRGDGCPAVAATGGDANATPCDVPVNGLVIRRWVRPAFAWSAGLAFALGGGRQGDMNLDTYAGVGPIVGVTLLLGQWKHLAIGASPEITWLLFKPASSADTVNHIEVSGALEAELHFGFIELPALSLSFRAGPHLELDRGGDTSVWALGFVGPSSAWGLLNNLAVRYYF